MGGSIAGVSTALFLTRQGMPVLLCEKGILGGEQSSWGIGVEVKTAIDWLRQYRETGRLSALPMGGRWPKKLVGEHRDWLAAALPGAWTSRCAGWWRAGRTGLSVDYRWSGRSSTPRSSVTKKDADRPGAGSSRRGAPARPMGAYQNRIDPSRLVFIDETWTKTNMAPLRGWAPRGERLPAKVPHGRWKTMTFLAALRHDRVVAPWLIEGPINGESFLLYVEKVLVPTLKPGDIVIMDNLGSHEARRCAPSGPWAPGSSSCPSTRPDLNPIEMFFAKLKHWLRKAAWRSNDAIYSAISAILPDVSPNECRNFFTHAGYGQK